MVLFTNGYLTIPQNETEPQFDDKGNIIIPEPDISNAIPCQIDTSCNLVAIQEGNAPTLTATVYVNYQDAPDNFKPSHIRLFHTKKGELGVYTVKSFEYYDLTQAFVITV